jgi:hypothetical protein
MERVCRPSDKLRAEPGSRSAFAYGDHMYFIDCLDALRAALEIVSHNRLLLIGR